MREQGDFTMNDKELTDATEKLKTNDANNGVDDSKNESGLSIFQVIYSVLAAMFGVQNQDRHKRDFEKGDPTQFIVVGILFVVVFVFGLIWIVNGILAQQ